MYFVESTLNQLNQSFNNEINNGILDIITPSYNYYSKIKVPIVDKIFNDTFERIEWRTKQNLDTSYLMQYCHSRSTYYLHVSNWSFKKWLPLIILARVHYSRQKPLIEF